MSSDHRPDLEIQPRKQNSLWQFCMNYVGGTIAIAVAAISAHYLMALIG